MMMGHCGNGGWAHWVWMAETFLLWALLITAVVLVVRYLISLGGASASPPAGRAYSPTATRAARSMTVNTRNE
jgi:putative membrane protein